MSKENDIIENLSIDCVVFGFDEDKLKLLLVKHGEGIRKGEWAIPGGFVLESEDMDDSAYRILRDTTGVSNIYMGQFRTFGEKDRYPVRRVFTIAYFAMIRPNEYKLMPGFTAEDVKWAEISEIPPLIFDHSDIVRYGHEHLKDKLKREPIGFNLLPKEFNMKQLQTLYEVILGEKLESVKFRSNMLRTRLLRKVQSSTEEIATINTNYSFDEEMYKKFVEDGLTFDF